MKMEPVLSVKVVEIVSLTRISQSQPTAWEGVTQGQQRVHITYKHGRLEVALRVAMEERRGGFEWLTILSFYPEWMEMQLSDQQQGLNLDSRANRERWMIFEQKLLREIRGDRREIEKQGNRRGPRVVSFSQLVYWMNLRNIHFDWLSNEGQAGSDCKIKIGFSNTMVI